MPKITVLMPTYNNEATIGAAIDSILAQTFTDFELIVIDDASTDGTAGVLATYGDARLRVVRNPSNLKITRALNLGLAQAQGDYIARMDADDISLPHRLAAQNAYLDAHPAVGVVGAWIEIFGAGRVYAHRSPRSHDEIVAASFFVNPMSHPTVMMRRAALAGACYSEAYPYAEDWEFWRRLAMTTRLANLPQVLVRYRITCDAAKPAAPDRHNGKEKLLHENLVRLGLPVGDYSRHLATVDQQVVSADALRDIESYLLKASVQNHAKGVYPVPVFDAEIGRQWFLCCRVAWCSGLPGWKMYMKSPLRRLGGVNRAALALMRLRMIAGTIKRVMLRPSLLLKKNRTA